ncbi:MAG: hypothetical protein K6U10_02510 [Acidobacteriia bacterium]|nr:hypothetical protein [Methyloceanibacter sp.]MCL6490674.1 hypothetical protein [Terriglobia bacterium]
MPEWAQALLLLVILLASSVVGRYFGHILSDRLANRQVMEVIQIVATMLVTFAALVLGLLTTSAKASFDAIDNDLRGFASQIIQFDRLLQEYGPEAEPVREMMRRYTATAIATTWPDEPPPPGYDPSLHVLPVTSAKNLESLTLGDLLNRVEEKIRDLQPQDRIQRQLTDELLLMFRDLIAKRWQLIEEGHGSISTPFLLVLDLWLVIVFLSFGLIGPRNPISTTIIVLAAISIASAMFVILEFDTPFGGLIVANSEPLRNALAHLNR